MIEKLLNLTKDILNLCNLTLEEKISPNTDVVKLIKREFEKQYESIINEKKIIVLNNRRDIWAARTITDSANFDYDKNLFDKVYEFAKLCERLPKIDLIVLYK